VHISSVFTPSQSEDHERAHVNGLIKKRRRQWVAEAQLLLFLDAEAHEHIWKPKPNNTNRKPVGSYRKRSPIIVDRSYFLVIFFLLGSWKCRSPIIMKSKKPNNPGDAEAHNQRRQSQMFSSVWLVQIAFVYNKNLLSKLKYWWWWQNGPNSCRSQSTASDIRAETEGHLPEFN